MTAHLIVLLGCLSLAAPPPPPSQVDPREIVRAFDGLESYLAIVAKYRAGQHVAAVAAVRQLNASALAASAKHLTTLRGQLAIAPVQPFQLDVVDFEGAVVLHTEAAFFAFRDGKRDEGRVQMTHAHELITLLTTAIETSTAAGSVSLAARKNVIGSRDWHMSVVLMLSGLRETMQADYFAADAVSQFPDDAELRLAAGTIQEELANAYDREAEYQIGMASSAQYGAAVAHRRVLAGASREAAVAHFTRALSVEPTLFEAAIRRGRVLSLQRKWPEARASIEAVLPGLTSRPLVYLAELFLGGIFEAEGRLGDAVLAYRRAATMHRGSQAARVALSHGLERAGVTDEALDVMRPLLALDPPRSYEEDPWWEYPRGRYRDGLAMLETFRTRVHKP